MANKTDLIASLREASQNHSPAFQLVGAQLQGADLSGITLSHLSLANANLDGVDLTGAQLTQVNLTNTSFREARLNRARFELVYAGSAIFTNCQACEARWEQCDLSRADFTGSNLQKAVIRGCSLESSCFDQVNFLQAMVGYSNADAASFRASSWMWANTVGSYFSQADFTDAKQFFVCREIIVEILRRHIKDDWMMAGLIGTVAIAPKWCYPEWKQFLELQPEYRELAFKIFESYQDSGFTEALREGWRPSEFGETLTE